MMVKGRGTDREEYSALVDRYLKDPSMENYVELRRIPGSSGIGVTGIPSGEALLKMSDDLAKEGITRELVLDVIECDSHDIEAMDQLSLCILEALVKRRKLERAGKDHLQSRGEAISDELVNYLILVMLDTARFWNGELPTSLIILLREQLGGVHSVREQAYEKERKRELAAFYGFVMLRKGQAPTIRRVAKKMGVQPSTVLRWFPNNSFRSEVERWRRTFEPPFQKGRRPTDT